MTFASIDLARVSANFEFAMTDVRKLLEAHDSETKQRRGRPPREVAVFKRAALILELTAWESFIEEAIYSIADLVLERAQSPDDVRRWFNTTAQGWLEGQPKLPDLTQWVGSGWKSLLKKKLEADLGALNTPNSAKIKAISKRFLDIDLTEHWTWKKHPPSETTKRLDELIHLRGRLVHEGPKFFEADDALRRKDVVDGMDLLKSLQIHTIVDLTALEMRIDPSPEAIFRRTVTWNKSSS